MDRGRGRGGEEVRGENSEEGREKRKNRMEKGIERKEKKEVGNKRKVKCRAWRVRVKFFFSSRGRHTRLVRDWSSDVCRLPI